jgi:hypothetical protein
MAMTIFFLLNGLGVIFLMYVLANFWKEGRRETDTKRRYANDFMESGVAHVFVFTHPISHSAYGGVAVVPTRGSGDFENHEGEYRRFIDELDEMPIEIPAKTKRLSAR